MGDAHGLELLTTLAGSLAAALVCGYVTQRLGLSPIVGYLLAGVAVGGHTPGFEANAELAGQLAELGVVLLMFGVGLHFDVDDLLGVRRIAVPGALGQSAVATLLGVLLGLMFWNATAGVVFGLAISVASTVVLTRVLADNNKLHTPVGRVAVGWLVVEDLLTVFVLVVLPAILGDNAATPASIGVALVAALFKIALLVAVALVIGNRAVPWLLERVALTQSRELFTLTTLVVALGIAVASAQLFDVSMPLGAFLAGMIVARSDYSLRAATEALPMRDAFAVLFFVSVGMLFDPQAIVAAPGLALGTLAIVMLGKPLAAAVIVLYRGYSVNVALPVAVVLGQIGEFSFILASLGEDLNVLPDDAMNAIVAAAIVSIAANPLLFRLVGPIEAALARNNRLWRALHARVKQHPELAAHRSAEEQDLERGPQYRAVIVGYGPVGQTLSRLLRDNGVEPTIIEMNVETVRRLRSEGLLAVYGDAKHPTTLIAAGVEQAGTLILSSSSTDDGSEIIRLARELNPGMRVLARAAYLRERPALRRVGADRVFTGEGEVALAMTEYMLTGLGATPEQIDRERQRVRADLFGRQAPHAEPFLTPLEQPPLHDPPAPDTSSR